MLARVARNDVNPPAIKVTTKIEVIIKKSVGRSNTSMNGGPDRFRKLVLKKKTIPKSKVRPTNTPGRPLIRNKSIGSKNISRNTCLNFMPNALLNPISVA